MQNVFYTNIPCAVSDIKHVRYKVLFDLYAKQCVNSSNRLKYNISIMFHKTCYV